MNKLQGSIAVTLFAVSVLYIGRCISQPKSDDCELHTYFLRNAAGKPVAFIQVAQHKGLYWAGHDCDSEYRWEIKNNWTLADTVTIDMDKQGRLLMKNIK